MTLFQFRPASRLIASAIVVALICTAARGGIILSEVMYDPQGTDTNREWVEIFNNGATPINLSGWQFGRPNANQWTSAFPTGTTLGANQALVITPSISTFDSDWGTGKNRIQVSSFPSLPNDPASGSDGRIAIRDNVGAIQDDIYYRNSSGWPNVGGNDGHSIYLLPQHVGSGANDSGSNWRPSSQGVYGAYWRGAGGASENHASPGYVATQQQAPFTPSADASWSMVIVPDTQNYVARDAAQYGILEGQMNWIVNNKDAFNIQVVLQEGDIVNRNSGTASNGVTAVQQWQRARDAFAKLNGVVPYIMATGNHDYGTTNSQNRDTKFNTYFKATDNPLVNPATGGILKGTMTPGELQNAYFEFEAPDGRDMLIFSLEFWPRDSVVNWAKGIAQQPQYAEHTAVLLTHSIINSGDGYWRTSDESYAMEGGNDGLDLWNKLLKVSPNFEMTFNGHIGGDGVGYRVDTSNAGDKVHQMLLNSQFETNAGNGWMRILEFLQDGESVRVRTYSPHFNLTRTNAANQFTISISSLFEPATALIWNINGSGTFTDGFAASDGSGGVGMFPVSPWDNPGKQELLVGYGAVATVSGNVTRTVGAMRIGTDQASSLIADRNGTGTVTASGAFSLTLASSADSTGDLVVGEGGYAGTLNWNASGTLDAQGKLRVGQGGTGVLNQNGGIIVAGNTAGLLKYVAIGASNGGDGAYNLNNGTFRPGGGVSGSQLRQVIVGDVGAVGMLNIGDGLGGADTAIVETDDDIILGRGGGAGGMTIAADGKLWMAGNGAPLIIAADEGSIGIVVQTGGSASIDGEVHLGAAVGATGSYTISGGSLTTAADGNGALLIGRAGGNGKLRVEGTAIFEHKAEAFIGNLSSSGAVGRFEIAGSTASVKIGQLENVAGGDAGVSETLRWEADAGGVSPLVVTGSGLLSSNRVQLQDMQELAANTGAAATLTGDGIALELNLAAFAGSGTLLLIDNLTADPITGFFERADSRELYAEGAAILGTGYAGSVNISYVGGTGNDVVLNLVAAAIHNADFNGDGVVDGNDFLAWQRGYGTTTGATLQQGDANGDGAVNADDLQLWKDQVGQPAPAMNPAAANVPEPAGIALAAFAITAICCVRRGN